MLTISNEKAVNKAVMACATSMLLVACNEATMASEHVSVSKEVAKVDASGLAKNWKGESICSKGSDFRSDAVFSTLIPTGPSSFEFIAEIPGLEGSSTINFNKAGVAVSGVSPNGAKLSGRFSNNYNSFFYTGARRADGLKCVVNMEVE